MRRKAIFTVAALMLTTGGIFTWLNAQAAAEGQCSQTCAPACCDDGGACPPDCDDSSCR